MKIDIELVSPTEHFIISVPFHVSDIKFSDFCDFKMYEKMYFEAGRKNEIAEQKRALIQCVKCLITATSQKETKITDLFMELEYSDKRIEHLIFSIAEKKKVLHKKIKEFAEFKKTKSLEFLIEKQKVLEFLIEEFSILKSKLMFNTKSNCSIVSLHTHLVEIIEGYQPEKCKQLTTHGSTFYLQGTAIKKSIMQEENNPLTSGEIIELLELQKGMDSLKTGEFAHDSNINFSLGLREMAILYRKENELLPLEKEKLEKFIQERSKMFAEITLNYIFDLSFFFHDFLKLCINEKIRLSFSAPRKEIPQQQMKVVNMNETQNRKHRRLGKSTAGGRIFKL